MSSALVANPADTTSPRWRLWSRGKGRIILAWVVALSFALFVDRLPNLNGSLLCLAGALLRVWASGYLRKEERPAVGGPYAWCRNPLYLGTYLMALGCAWAFGLWVHLAILTIVFGIVYHLVILDEELKLRAIFGAPYLLYIQRVPRFLPYRFPLVGQPANEINPDPRAHRFDVQLAWKNRAQEAIWSWVGLILGLTVIGRLALPARVFGFLGY